MRRRSRCRVYTCGGASAVAGAVTPGRVWLQSLPLSRLATRIVAAVPGLGRGGREEGSLLGGIGRIIDGDNS